MNFLAHACLSDGTPENVTGQLMADFVKGAEVQALPPAVLRGVRHHQAVDNFTDQHPLHVQSRQRLGAPWRRVSGIVIDLWYDHLLSRHWAMYGSATLTPFLAEVHDRLLEGSRNLAPPHRATAERMVRDRLLESYTSDEGIAWALTRVSARLCGGRFRLQDALPVLHEHSAALARDFHAFFPELLDFAHLQLHDRACAFSFPVRRTSPP